MVIAVLEGPDGSGKTTLSDLLRARFGFGYRHEGPPPPDVPPLDYYTVRLYDAVLEAVATKGVVLDRFALGDRVYGPLLRGEDRFGDDGWRKMRERIDAVPSLRVLCLPPYEAALTAWRARNVVGREFVKDEELFRRTYDAWAAFRHDPGQLVYDWTAPGAFYHVAGEVERRRFL